MRYLTGILAESHTLVEGCGTEPHGPLFYARVEHLPQTNMMSLLCAAANGHFVSKVLAAAVIK